ncbi:unnamed protein product [Owenia fusiformis]|uniref:Uncharacterized protein n=1 Tax=Owenia fusiformis TaxID=6347 RepID=A0A8J1U6C8_OWEFU|nr:unnamed protein product [Owenia fusiformis]
MYHSGAKHLKTNLSERSQGQQMRPGEIQNLVDFLKGNQMQRETTEMRMKRRDPLPDIGKTANLRNIDLDRGVNINIEETLPDDAYNELECQQNIQAGKRCRTPSPPPSMHISPRSLNTINKPSVLPQSLGSYGNEMYSKRSSKTRAIVGCRRPVANVRHLPPIQRIEPPDRPSAPEPRPDIVIPSVDGNDDIDEFNAQISGDSHQDSAITIDENIDRLLSPIQERNDSSQDEYSNHKTVHALRREFSDVTLEAQTRKSQSQINTFHKQGRESVTGISKDSDIVIRPASPNATRTQETERPWAPEPSSMHSPDMDHDGEPIDFIDVN